MNSVVCLIFLPFGMSSFKIFLTYFACTCKHTQAHVYTHTPAQAQAKGTRGHFEGTGSLLRLYEHQE